MDRVEPTDQLEVLSAQMRTGCQGEGLWPLLPGPLEHLRCSVLMAAMPQATTAVIRSQVA